MNASARSVNVRRAMSTMVVMLPVIMQAIDTTITNVALPTIKGAMSATSDQASWVLTSYILAMAVMTAPAGYLASRFGRRTVFMVSIVGFTVSSLLCGMAVNIEELVLFRIIQGLSGAALVPMSQAILLDNYPLEKRGHAMALWGMGVMLGPIIGPTLGGYITEWFNWRWIFLINLPIGLLSLLGVFAYIDQTEKDRALPFDWTGFVLLSVAVAGLQLMLDRGHLLDWFNSTEVIIECVLAGLCLYLFTVHIFTAKQPFIPTELFRDRNFVAGLAISFVMGSITFTVLALIPPFLENLLGYPVDLIGEVMAPRGFGTMAGMLVAGRLTNRADARLLVGVGMALNVLSLWTMSLFNLNTQPSDVIVSGVINGLGLGFIVTPLSTIAYSTLSPKLRNEGTSMYSLTRNLGSSIGISVVITQLSQGTQMHRASLVERISEFDVQSWSDGARSFLTPDNPVNLTILDYTVNTQAAVMSYIDDFRLIMIAAALSIPSLLLMKRPDYSVAIAQQVAPDHG